MPAVGRAMFAGFLILDIELKLDRALSLRLQLEGSRESLPNGQAVDLRALFYSSWISLRFSAASTTFRRLSAQKIARQVLKGLGQLRQRVGKFCSLRRTRIGSTTPTASTRCSRAPSNNGINLTNPLSRQLRQVFR